MSLTRWHWSDHDNDDHPSLSQDGSGAISAEELLEVMRAMGENPTEDEVLIIFNIIRTFLLRYWLFDRYIV